LENSVSTYTDDAPSQVASITGFFSLVKKENPAIVKKHCSIHREMLVSKTPKVNRGRVFKKVFELKDEL
jgi:hypothetical protein